VVNKIINLKGEETTSIEDHIQLLNAAVRAILLELELQFEKTHATADSRYMREYRHKLNGEL